jgi:hypothetical protein
MQYATHAHRNGAMHHKQAAKRKGRKERWLKNTRALGYGGDWVWEEGWDVGEKIQANRIGARAEDERNRVGESHVPNIQNLRELEG